MIVSACYSGGFVEPLRDDYTAVITASAPTRKSFGCSSESDATYLAKALFEEELRRTYSFEKAFESARKSIAERERAQGYEPSEPQMHMGPALRVKLAEIERRLAAREAGAASGVRDEPAGSASVLYHRRPGFLDACMPGCETRRSPARHEPRAMSFRVATRSPQPVAGKPQSPFFRT